MLDETARGVFTIAATPFLPDGALDEASLDTMTNFYEERGVLLQAHIHRRKELHFVLICGLELNVRTGEVDTDLRTPGSGEDLCTHEHLEGNVLDVLPDDRKIKKPQYTPVIALNSSSE